MLKEVYGNKCLFLTQVFEWFKRFKEGRETTEDNPRPGLSSTSKMDENIEKSEVCNRIGQVVFCAKAFETYVVCIVVCTGINVYPTHKFLNGLNEKRDVKRPKTIRAPGGPQRKNRTKTFKKV
ncbi:hypothetical protein NQ318_022413, partial [Aromia moschata]